MFFVIWLFGAIMELKWFDLTCCLSLYSFSCLLNKQHKSVTSGIIKKSTGQLYHFIYLLLHIIVYKSYKTLIKYGPLSKKIMVASKVNTKQNCLILVRAILLLLLLLGVVTVDDLSPSHQPHMKSCSCHPVQYIHCLCSVHVHTVCSYFDLVSLVVLFK